MALFSRGRRNEARDDSTAQAAESVEPPVTQAAASAEPAAPEQTPEPEATPTVNISMSSYQTLGSRPQAGAPSFRGAQEAPAAAETMPGMPDNTLLQAALGKLTEQPDPADLMDVARQLLQGQLFLRVQGDVQALLAAGQGLPLAVANHGDKQFIVVYSGGEPLRASLKADGATDSSAMGQPAISVLKYVLSGESAGIVLDPASPPARAVLPRDLLERLVESADEVTAVKQLLSSPRTAETSAKVAEALLIAPLWVAARQTPDGTYGVAEARDSNGVRRLELYSHPIEITAMRRGDYPAPIGAAQLGAALRSDTGLAGVVLDPAGPWIELDRADLAEVLALPEA